MTYNMRPILLNHYNKSLNLFEQIPYIICLFMKIVLVKLDLQVQLNFSE